MLGGVQLLVVAGIVVLIWAYRAWPKWSLYRLAVALDVDEGWTKRVISEQMADVSDALLREYVSLANALKRWAMELPLSDGAYERMSKVLDACITGQLKDSHGMRICYILNWLSDELAVPREQKHRHQMLWDRAEALSQKLATMEWIRERYPQS